MCIRDRHGKSRGLQRAGDGVLRQLGRVVLLGKVREQDVARAALHGEPRKFRRRCLLYTSRPRTRASSCRSSRWQACKIPWETVLYLIYSQEYHSAGE